MDILTNILLSLLFLLPWRWAWAVAEQAGVRIKSFILEHRNSKFSSTIVKIFTSKIPIIMTLKSNIIPMIILKEKPQNHKITLNIGGVLVSGSWNIFTLGGPKSKVVLRAPQPLLRHWDWACSERKLAKIMINRVWFGILEDQLTDEVRLWKRNQSCLHEAVDGRHHYWGI